jgi:hypothetical protein
MKNTSAIFYLAVGRDRRSFFLTYIYLDDTEFRPFMQPNKTWATAL